MKIFPAFLTILLMPLIAGASGPYWPENIEFHEGSEILFDRQAGMHTYMLRSNPAEFSQTVTSYSGMDSDFSKVRSFSGRKFFDSKAAGGLHSLTSSDGEFRYILIDSTPEIVQDLFLTKVRPGQPLGKAELLAESGLVFISLYNYIFVVNSVSGAVDTIRRQHDEFVPFYIENLPAGLALLSKSGESLSLYTLNGDFLKSIKMNFSGSNRLYQRGNFIFCASSDPMSRRVFIRTVDLNNGLVVSGKWINARGPEMIKLTGKQGAEYIALSAGDGNYVLRKGRLHGVSDNSEIIAELPEMLIEPLVFSISDGKAFAVFKNGIAIVKLSDGSVSVSYERISEYFSDAPGFHFISGKIVLNAVYGTWLADLMHDEYWKIRLLAESVYSYLIYGILALAIIFLARAYRRQKRVLREMTEISSLGAILVIDSNGRLTMANSRAAELLAGVQELPPGRAFGYYFSSEATYPIRDMLDNSFKIKENDEKRIPLRKSGTEREWLCNSIILRGITGKFRGIVFTAIDITEQLEKKRLSNWAQLAHDMQTNLSTIRLNAEHLDPESGENVLQRQKKIIYQVNLLMKRVRDIVTVGRNDILEMSNENASELCKEARKEFDDSFFPGVEFEMELKNFIVTLDKPKFIRALRNAIENGIKALPDKMGKIKITCYKEGADAFFKIADTGRGMDESTRKKMMTPYFTTARKSGGSGIGTMIMQHVAELHNGRLLVNTTQGAGTEVIFIIPNSFTQLKSKLIKKDVALN